MRPHVLLSGLFALAGLANAQYFSAGWTPGQPVPSSDPAAASKHPAPPAAGVQSAQTPPASKSPSGPSSFLDKLVTAGPVAALTSLVGFDLAGTQEVGWDERIPLITDANYVDTIVNEAMTPEEEEQRVWFLVITVTAGQPEGISKFVDDVFDQTYEHALEKGDLPHVRFGRIDYLNVTTITTKWAVWTAPTLVVLKDRGRTLRFYKGGQMHFTAELLYQFLKGEGWRMKEPWRTAYSPGGDREWIMDYLALVLSTVYDYVVRVPRWIMYVLSGGAASVIINLLHKPSAKHTQQPAPKLPPKPKQEESSAVPVAVNDKRVTTPAKGQKGAGKRKGRK
ncbi:hypothetical protein ID866_8207 [Astraeus odoratus]|nr:hypothetical protein ID866_8207 [Astraeus odoratus]